MAKQVKTLSGLRKLVDEKKSVFCPKSPCFTGPRPAAFIINLQGSILLNLFKSGMYEYQKQEVKKQPMSVSLRIGTKQ